MANRIDSSRHPLLTKCRELGTTAGRVRHGQFLAEGELIVSRAVEDGLPIEMLLFTESFIKSPTGAELWSQARARNLSSCMLTSGMLAKITTSRPVPDVIAVLSISLESAEQLQIPANALILAVENVNNPDNLGMTLRTADAAGVYAVVLADCDPLHKNCVRAARGAVGRFRIALSENLPELFRRWTAEQVTVLAATGQGADSLYSLTLPPPLVVAVGNENAGLTEATLAACSGRVRIPMAPGQDSLNVGVAAGIFLFEARRQQGW